MYETRLELAINPDYPGGSKQCGYELKIPLTEEFYIDQSVYEDHSKLFQVTRFWENELDRKGKIVQRGKHVWHLEFKNGEKEPIFQFEKERLLPGEFVDIRDHGEQMHVFKVVSLTSLESVDHN